MSRAAEADRAAFALQLALAQVGAATMEDALKLWDDLPLNATAAQVDAWLTRAIHLIFSRRSLSSDLAIAYYRLARALRTGSTVPKPGEPVRAQVTLAELRREFRLLAEEARDRAPARHPAYPESRKELEDVELPREPEDGIVIPIDRDARDVLEADDSWDDEAEDDAEELLIVLGPERVKRGLERVDKEKPASEVDEQRSHLKEKAGVTQAAAAAKVAQDAGRRRIFEALDKDSRVIGYARITDSDPCAFCAMLASRGPVYKSRRAAGDKKFGGKDFHPNCQCSVVEIYSMQQYRTSAATKAAREYEDLYEEFTKSRYYRMVSGTQNDLLNGWRRFLRARAKQAGSQRAISPEATQEASAA